MCNNSMPDQLDALRRIEVSMIACLEAEFLDTSAGNTEGDNEDDIDAVPVVDCNYVDPVDRIFDLPNMEAELEQERYSMVT